MPIERNRATYICDISGLAGEGLDELEVSKVDEDDPLSDAPLGWTRITITTRIPNEDLAQTVAMYKEAQESLKKDLKNDPTALQNALWALDAQFGDFLDQPEYTAETAEMWVHPSAATEAILRLNPDFQSPADEGADLEDDEEIEDEDQELDSDPEIQDAESAKTADEGAPSA